MGDTDFSLHYTKIVANANLILNAVMEKRISLESRGKEASQVTELNLDNVRTVGEFEGLTDNFENLEKLSVTAAGLTSFKGFPKLKSLKKLDVSDNRISNGLHALKNCHSLTHISLSNNEFKDISSLEPLKCLENLKYLEVANNPFTEEEEVRSRIFTMLPRLELLDNQDKEGNEVEDEEDEVINGVNHQQDENEEEVEDGDDEEDLEDEDEDEGPGLADLYNNTNLNDEEDGDYNEADQVEEDEDIEEEEEEEDEEVESTRGKKRKFDDEGVE